MQMTLIILIPNRHPYIGNIAIYRIGINQFGDISHITKSAKILYPNMPNTNNNNIWWNNGMGLKLVFFLFLLATILVSMRMTLVWLGSQSCWENHTGTFSFLAVYLVMKQNYCHNIFKVTHWKKAIYIYICNLCVIILTNCLCRSHELFIIFVGID